MAELDAFLVKDLPTFVTLINKYIVHDRISHLCANQLCFPYPTSVPGPVPGPVPVSSPILDETMSLSQAL